MPESLDESDSDGEEEAALDELASLRKGAENVVRVRIRINYLPLRPFLRPHFVLFPSLFLLRLQDSVRSSAPFGTIKST